MVSSGLVDRTDVSQYRLAAHLIVACFIFAYALWLARALAPHSLERASVVTKQLAPVMVAFIFITNFTGRIGGWALMPD